MSGRRSDFLPRLAGIVWVLLVAWVGMFLSAPPSAVPESAPATEFSAHRAMQHIREIARAPHPVGSAEHARVRDYLIAQLRSLGLESTVQKTVGLLAEYGSAATVENVLARKRGSAPGPALLLVAHYDSVPAGPGAGDDGAGIACLLETARALSAGPPLRHDVIFLFSDGEELGLLGASAFAAEHPWKNDVGVVLNFDNRGSRGAVLMYETSAGNLGLVRELAAAAPAPRATSLSAAVARLMPNSSDFFVLRKAGLAGLNFAFIGGPQNYHTPQDTPQNVDLRTLQHAGSYALPLARRLADSDLSRLARADGPAAVYFNPAGNWLVVYPMSWARPLAIAVFVLFLLVAGAGLARGVVRAGSVLLAVVLCVVSLLAAWRVADAIAVYVQRFYAIPGNAGPYLYHPLYPVALVCLVAGFTFAIWEVASLRWEEIALAGTGVWSAIALATAFWFPEASYLGVWPVVPALAVLGIVFLRRRAALGHRDVFAAGLAWMGAVPAVLLLAPLLPSVHLALGISEYGAAAQALVIALAAWLLAPVLAPRSPNPEASGSAPERVPRPRASVSLILLTAGAAVLVAALLTVRYNDRHPRPEWMAYVVNADQSAAQWMSEIGGNPLYAGAAHVDPWRSQFLTDTPHTAYTPIPLPGRSEAMCWAQTAPLLDLPPPAAELVSEIREDSSRVLRIRLRSRPGTARLTIQAQSQRILSLRVNGKDVAQRRVTGATSYLAVTHGDAFPPRETREIWGLLYAAPPEEGLEIAVSLPPDARLQLTVADISDGLPVIPGQTFSPRPPSVTQQHLTDMTVVMKSFAF
jgi:hypothetical protein